MAKHLDEDTIEEEQLREEDEDDNGEKEKKVFINNLDSFQGKCIARVSTSWKWTERNQLMRFSFLLELNQVQQLTRRKRKIKTRRAVIKN